MPFLLRIAVLALLLENVFLKLDAQPAMMLVVETVAVAGAEKTLPRVILNEMTLERGDSVRLDRLAAELERSRNNVYNLGLFNEVTMKHYILAEQVHLIVEVVERWYVYGSPYLQVEERNSYDLVNALLDLDFRRLAYGVSLEWRNVTGRNETLSFFGQAGFSQRLAINYNRPSLRRNGLDYRLGFHYLNMPEVIIGTEQAQVQWRRVEQEALHRNFRIHVGVRKRWGLYRTLYGELSYRYDHFSDSLYQFTLEGESPRTITTTDGREYFPTLILKFFEDKRDYRAYPLSGYKYQLLGRLSGGPSAVATATFGKVGATWAQHLPIGERWNFAYGSQHILTLGDSLPFFAKSYWGIGSTEFAGVSSNLRGYEPYALAGTYLGVIKTEWKYALMPRKIYHIPEIPMRRFQDLQFGLYLTAFADAAYLRDDSFSGQDQLFRQQLLHSYGLGLNVIWFYDMLLRLEYSINHLRQGGVYVHAELQIK